MAASGLMQYDSSGWTSKILLIPNTDRVIKAFNEDCNEHLFPNERAVYERLMAADNIPPSILRYHGVSPEVPAGLILDLAENRSVAHYLSRYPETPPSPHRLILWARQAAEGLAFMHECGIWHCDIHIVNFVLDRELNLKLCDFAGSSINGQKSHSFYRRTHQVPDRAKDYTAHAEIFALGSAMYHMVTGHDLYHGELHYEGDKHEIRRRMRQGEFPEVTGLRALGDVISRCWRLQYDTMKQVIQATDEEEVRLRDPAGM